MASAHLTIGLNFLSPFLTLADFPLWWAPLDANPSISAHSVFISEKTRKSAQSPTWAECSRSPSLTWQPPRAWGLSTSQRQLSQGLASKDSADIKTERSQNSPWQSHSKISQRQRTNHLPTQVQHSQCPFSTGSGSLGWAPEERAGLDFRTGL